MTDRQPTNPGRVLITPEDGSAPFYAVMTMADDPIVEGTALNKANLLSDATAQVLLPGVSDPTPDMAFAALAENQYAAMPKAGGEFEGDVVAHNPAVETPAIRNISAGTTDLTAGTTELASGSVYFVYA